MKNRDATHKNSHVGRPVRRRPVYLANLHFEILANRVPHLLGLFVLTRAADDHPADRVTKLRHIGPRESLAFGIDCLGLRASKSGQYIMTARATQMWRRA